VEAARAGEAGAGFAVVADEVRNLAMRAADAARDTSRLIEESVKQIKDGAELVDVTNKAFDEVAVQAGKVTQLVGEIAEASGEQAQGVEQINTAVSEMDRVVQQNAASASEEMNAQAAQMSGMVDELVVCVEGHGRGGRPADPRPGSGRTDESMPGRVQSRNAACGATAPKGFQSSGAARARRGSLCPGRDLFAGVSRVGIAAAIDRAADPVSGAPGRSAGRAWPGIAPFR
jgi:methyl-accepting chemotaxis protein